MDMLEQSLDSAVSHEKQEEEVVQITEGDSAAAAEQTAVTIAGVQQAATFADHNIQYQFRSENTGGQVTYRVVQVTDQHLEGADDGEGRSASFLPLHSPEPSRQSHRSVLCDDDPSRCPSVRHARTIAPRTHPYSTKMDGPRTPRDERRRAQHNEVERRRRDKINNWIVTLSKIIPDCNMDSSKTGASKGGILSKACDYIRELRQNNQRLQESFKEVERVQVDNDLLRQQIEELKNENALLRAQLQQHGIDSVGETTQQ